MTKLVAILLAASVAIWIMEAECDKGSDGEGCFGWIFKGKNREPEDDPGLEFYWEPDVDKGDIFSKLNLEGKQSYKKAYKTFANETDETKMFEAIETMQNFHPGSEEKVLDIQRLFEAMIDIQNIDVDKCKDEELINTFLRGLVWAKLEDYFSGLYKYLVKVLDNYLKKCDQESRFKQAENLKKYQTLADYLMGDFWNNVLQRHTIPIFRGHWNKVNKISSELRQGISVFEFESNENNVLCQKSRDFVKDDQIAKLADSLTAMSDTELYNQAYKNFAHYLEVCGHERRFEPVAEQLSKNHPDKWKTADDITLVEYLVSQKLTGQSCAEAILFFDHLVTINKADKDTCNFMIGGKSATTIISDAIRYVGFKSEMINYLMEKLENVCKKCKENTDEKKRCDESLELAKNSIVYEKELADLAEKELARD